MPYSIKIDTSLEELRVLIETKIEEVLAQYWEDNDREEIVNELTDVVVKLLLELDEDNPGGYVFEPES